jgi:hypothetical protein
MAARAGIAVAMAPLAGATELLAPAAAEETRLVAEPAAEDTRLEPEATAPLVVDVTIDDDGV